MAGLQTGLRAGKRAISLHVQPPKYKHPSPALGLAIPAGLFLLPSPFPSAGTDRTVPGNRQHRSRVKGERDWESGLVLFSPESGDLVAREQLGVDFSLFGLQDREHRCSFCITPPLKSHSVEWTWVTSCFAPC